MIVTIESSRGAETHEALVVEGGLAVVRLPAEWSLTHLASGCALGLFDSSRAALRAMRVVAPWFDWTLPGAPLVERMSADGLTDFFRTLLEELGRHATGQPATVAELRSFDAARARGAR
jgi:hypothetical protein